METIKVREKTTKRIKRIAGMWYKKNELTNKINKEIKKLSGPERQFYQEKIKQYLS